MRIGPPLLFLFLNLGSCGPMDDEERGTKRCIFNLEGFVGAGSPNGPYLQSPLAANERQSYVHFRNSTWLFYDGDRWAIGYLAHPRPQGQVWPVARQLTGNSNIVFGEEDWEENVAVFFEIPTWKQKRISIRKCEEQSKVTPEFCIK